MRGGSREPVTRGEAAAKTSPQAFYDADDIVDAPEHHEYARAMGLFTWGTWDTEPRPFEERLKDFLQAHPPEEPARFQGSMLRKTSEGEYGPGAEGERLLRLRAIDSSFGTLAEALARYGLKLQALPKYAPSPVVTSPFREITRLRNQRLRMLHGRVEVEAENMDEMKRTELERLERKAAAEQVRRAREEMRREFDAET